MRPPTLTTPRLVLDAPQPDDAVAWSEAQDEVCAHWFDWPAPPGVERCAAYIADIQGPREDEYVWAIRRDGSLVGGLDLRKLEDGRWNVTYFVAPHARGQHMAREALGAVVAWGSGTLGLDEISTNLHAENAASRRVLESVGFTASEPRFDADVAHDVVDYRVDATSTGTSWFETP